MSNFIEALNFSSTQTPNSIEIKKWSNVDHYNTLCSYCADYDIDLSDVSDQCFSDAADLMEEHGQYDKSCDSYFFSIDSRFRR